MWMIPFLILIVVGIMVSNLILVVGVGIGVSGRGWYQVSNAPLIGAF